MLRQTSAQTQIEETGERVFVKRLDQCGAGYRVTHPVQAFQEADNRIMMPQKGTYEVLTPNHFGLCHLWL